MGLKYDLDTQDVNKKMTCANCLFVSGSMVQTVALLAVGMAFFAPYWLSNIPAAGNELDYANPKQQSYLAGNVSYYPDRGLWAQCGAECEWFWENDYMLQRQMLTPLKWHLATQVLYFIGAALLLMAEIYARVQLCCDERTAVYWSLSVLVLISALIQLAAIATFGGGVCREPYNAISNPSKTTPVLGRSIELAAAKGVGPYIGWCFWMAVVGDILSVIAGVLFMITACGVARKY